MLRSRSPDSRLKDRHRTDSHPHLCSRFGRLQIASNKENIGVLEFSNALNVAVLRLPDT